jgi:hypothetical protein
MRTTLIFILILILIYGCNNSDNYLKLIQQQNELLNKEIDRNYRIITEFSENHEVKYAPWKHRCNEIIDLRDTLMNNRDNIEVLNYAVQYLEDYTKWLGAEKGDTYFEFLKIDFNIEDKIEKELFVNKILTVANSHIDKMVFLSNINNYRFTAVTTGISFSGDKRTYNLGEDVSVKLFLMGWDTTRMPKIIMADGEHIDSFTYNGYGIYNTKAKKKGINFIKGTYVYEYEYINRTVLDSFPFRAEYFVK